MLYTQILTDTTLMTILTIAFFPLFYVIREFFFSFALLIVSDAYVIRLINEYVCVYAACSA